MSNEQTGKQKLFTFLANMLVTQKTAKHNQKYAKMGRRVPP